MLKIHLMTITLLCMLLPKSQKQSWWAITAALLIMSLASLTLITSTSSMITSTSSMDQLSQPLITLSILIPALMMMTSTKILHNKTTPKSFIMMNLLLMLTLTMCFSSTNLFSFYILFEASLIPTMIIIMSWGYQPERVQASMYMMMYTILASLPMLILFIMIWSWSLSTNMSSMTLQTPPNMNHMFSLILIAGFLVKLPMFTTHLWLPKAHVEAPIAGSMILAAVLLKLGGYGILRIMINTPHGVSTKIQSTLISLSLIGAILTSMICLRQPDLKSLIAYSSVGHMGLMLAGACSNSVWGMMGATLMMIAHGLSSSALFSLANLSYESSHTRSMFLMKGLLSAMPTMSMWWFMFASSNMAAPPSLNLLSEIFLITSITSASLWTAMPLMIITFLAGAYSLHMYSATQHGQMHNFMNPTNHTKQKDMLMLLLHLTPLLALTIKPELMTTWL